MHSMCKAQTANQFKQAYSMDHVHPNHKHGVPIDCVRVPHDTSV